MQYIGTLQKMITNLEKPINYWLLLAADQISLNEYLGQEISLLYTGKISCIACGKVTKKSYHQGYCFPCTKKLARCDICMVKPELCHYHQGTCREPSWGEQHCFAAHIVYLANSSAIKIGITRETQVPTRWIDQGAIQALPIIKTTSRYQAGLIEVAIAKLISDKTNWRKMLRGDIEPVSLLTKRDDLFSKIAKQLQIIATEFAFGDIELLTAEEVVDLYYPVLAYPTKVTSLKFDQQTKITATLLGIKGQYLIFDTGVLNIRNHAGYEVQFS